MKKLGFGLMRLPILDANDPTSIDMPQLCQMVDEFLARGFRYFDTAYMYHKCKSEYAIRDALVKRHPRDSFMLASKLPTMFLEKEEDMERIFNEQREKCGVEFFDYYLIHNLNRKFYPIAEKLGAFDFVKQKKAAGLVGKFGFSFHDNAEMLDKILTDHPDVDFVQLQINYLDWESESVQSRLCYETARRHNKEIIIMEPVKGGTLARLPESAEALLRAHSPEASPASWAIRYAAGLEGVIMVLSGMSDFSQLCDNTDFMRDYKPLSEEEKGILLNVTDEIHKSIAIGCTGCGYCEVKCPQKLPIHKYFEIYNELKKRGDARELTNEYNETAKKYAPASACIKCRLCEKECPQRLPVATLLKSVVKSFEK